MSHNPFCSFFADRMAVKMTAWCGEWRCKTGGSTSDRPPLPTPRRDTRLCFFFVFRRGNSTATEKGRKSRPNAPVPFLPLLSPLSFRSSSARGNAAWRCAEREWQSLDITERERHRKRRKKRRRDDGSAVFTGRSADSLQGPQSWYHFLSLYFSIIWWRKTDGLVSMKQIIQHNYHCLTQNTAAS